MLQVLRLKEPFRMRGIIMKNIIALLLACVLLLGLAPVGIAEEAAQGSCVARVQFNLRAEPREDAERVCNSAMGTTLTLLEQGAEWCRLRTENGLHTGYAQTSWLKELRLTQAAAANETASGAALATGTDLPPVGESESGEVQYLCMTRTRFSIRETPSDDGRRLKEVKKGADLRMLAWGNEWCQVQTMDGRFTGYARTRWLFHYQSMDRFRWEVPGYEDYRLAGYVTMTGEAHITDSRNAYGGTDLHAGDVIFVRGEPKNGTVETLLRREFVSIEESKVSYTPVTPWREAKAGDVIGGYTQFYGLRQGGGYAPYRKHNIKLAMGLMNDTIIPSGEEYSFLNNVGPVTKGKGYQVAGITGGAGSGTGGGICHTSTLMYQAALSLPFLITEREPHTDDGTTYAPLEFDATVGVYSDLRFINTLPYDVKMEALTFPETGAITVRFVCMETLDPQVLANWNGPAAPAEAGNM